MLLRLFFTSILFVAVCWNAAGSIKPEFAGNGSIEGSVTDAEGIALPGATIILQELNTGTLTAHDGTFAFKGLRDGVYTLKVQYMGYRAQVKTVQLREGHSRVLFRMEATHIELDEVSVRDSRSGMMQPEQTLSVTRVGRDFLSEASTGTLMQNLQRLPGIHSMDIGTGISKPVIRGMGFNRVVVAQNNLKQEGQQWGADHGLEIDMYAVERVEVLKGPASLIYGSDALGGVINIKPPVVPQENTSRVEVNAFAHSNNDLVGLSAMTAHNRNGKFMRLRTTYRDFADYRVPAESFTYSNWVIPVPDRRLKNTSGNDLGLSFTGGIREGWGISSLTISNFFQEAGFFPASHGIPNPSSLSEPGNPRTTEYPKQKVNHLTAASNTHIILGNDRLSLDAGYQHNYRQELNPPHVHGAGPLPEGFLELELSLQTLSAAARYHRYVSPRQQYTFGLSSSYRMNARGGYNFLLPDYAYGEVGLYTVSTTHLSDVLLFNAGLRLDLATVEVEGFEEPVWTDSETISHYRTRAPSVNRNFSNLAFSTGLSWMPHPDWNVKINAGSGFRNPGAIELAANGMHHGSFRHEQGDASLEPERSIQLDLGLSRARKEFLLQFSPFINYFPNFLFLNPSGVFSELAGAGQIYRFEQAQALQLGGEAYADWHITHALHTSLGAEWVWAQNLDDNYPLPFTPAPSVLAELNYKIKPRISNVKEIKMLSALRITGAQNRVARNEPATPGYVLTNLGLSAKAEWGNFPLEIRFMVNNVLDVMYKNHMSFYRILELPEPGRNFTLQINSALNW